VAADVTKWQLQASTWNLLSKKLVPKLKEAQVHSREAPGAVRNVLAELQDFIALADEHEHTRDSRCATVLKQSLQEAYNSNTAQLADADVIAQWFQQHRQRGAEARHQLKQVNFICLLTMFTFSCAYYVVRMQCTCSTQCVALCRFSAACCCT
jgi:hypothetical protein